MKCITISFYKSYWYFIVYWIMSILLSFFAPPNGSQEKENQEYNKNIEFINKFIYLMSQTGGDLLAGFLVLYTFLTSSIIIEKENNIINKNRNKLCKRINRCSLILIVSIIEFACKIINLILVLYFKSLEIEEIICLIPIVTLSRIFFSHYILKIILYKYIMISLLIYLIGYSFKLY